MRAVLLIIVINIFNLSVYAQKKKVQDMSDPLAVFTQVGAGITNKGLNLKIGKSYDPGVPNTMAMNVIEFKGLLGEAVGWSKLTNRQRDNHIDSLRLRNFHVNAKNGRGTQLDLNYTYKPNLVSEENLSVNYSFIQALPQIGMISLYPLAGLGVDIGKNSIQDDQTIDSGYSTDGVYTLIGMYSVIRFSKKIWINYNPNFLSTLSGSEIYEKNAYGVKNSEIFLHEIALNYQITPVLNIKYFSNFSDEVDFEDGDHRVEFNYQF